MEPRAIVVGVLSVTEIESFVEEGYIAIRGAVPGDIVRACQDAIWAEVAREGVERGDPATWTRPVVRIPCPDSAPFAAAGTRPVLWEACDQLIGAGRWWHREGVGGTIPVRFPSIEDPGDAGWHLESSYQENGVPWVNIRSRARGLLVLYLFSDVDEASAPTRIRPGSHRDAARVLGPAGDGGMAWAKAAGAAATASEHRPTALATGAVGDVFVCHPFLVHAATWPHTGPTPRILAQPGVHLHGEFPLTEPLSPVEQAIHAAEPAPAAALKPVPFSAGSSRQHG